MDQRPTRGEHRVDHQHRPIGEHPLHQDQVERLGIAWNVNGPDDVTAAARQNFMQGATQIKIMQTGGVASLFDPWQLNGLNEDEIAAAVQVASNYGSYVAAHSYTKDSIMRALNMGVKTIEHGFEFDGDIAKLMEEKGAYLVTQMTSMAPGLADDPALQDPRTARKLQSAQAAFKSFIPNVKKFQPKFGFQTDVVGGPEASRAVDRNHREAGPTNQLEGERPLGDTEREEADRRHGQDRGQVPPPLGVAEHLARVSGERPVVEREVHAGQKHGQGTMKYPDGRIYVGDYWKGKRTGVGTMTYPNGQKVTGQFLDGEYIGPKKLE